MASESTGPAETPGPVPAAEAAGSGVPPYTLPVTPGPAEAPALQGQPHTGPTSHGTVQQSTGAQPPAPAPQPPASQGQPQARQPQGWGEGYHHPAPPQSGHHPGQYGGQYGHAQQPQPYDPYYGHPPVAPGYQGPPPAAPNPQAPQGYPGPQSYPAPPNHPAPQAYGHGYHPPQGEYPAPPAVPHPQHPPQQHPPYPVAYPVAYPAPYQAPGYAHPGHPMTYPGHSGRPVQYVIVFVPGQQPQVITADAVASTLVPERAEPEQQHGAQGSERALTTADPAAPGTDPADGATGEASTAAPGDRADTGAPAPGQTPGRPQTDPAQAGTAQQAEHGKGGPQCPVEAAELLNEALSGLAMRDLSLVDALLEMVEELETDAQDPNLLDKLFQIDNYATRMRRNGENFLVLTGHDGGESDAHDEIVPLLDVARAASSEIKDYPRVRLATLPQISITGLAADDISHLLAELLDNATANSPEHAPVTVSARELDDGRLMIVVEDEGVGVPEKQLEELNERLVGEPVLDDEVRRHMGLYVASRIAHKHGLETRLEPRSYRGISAYTVVPEDLLRVATPRTMNSERASASGQGLPGARSAPDGSAAPAGPAGRGAQSQPAQSGEQSAPKQPADGNGQNGSDQAGHDPASVTAAGLPRRSATPQGSPLRMMPRPGHAPGNPKPPARPDTPPKLTGQARAEQIRDELGDFLDGERAAREGEELDGGQ